MEEMEMSRNIKISLLSLLVLIGSVNAVVQNEEINVALPLAFNSWSPEVQKQYMAINSYVQGLIYEAALCTKQTTENTQIAEQKFMDKLADLIVAVQKSNPAQPVMQSQSAGK